MSLDTLFRHIPGQQTRWASAENPRGERGAGGQVLNGRKGRPSVRLAPGDTLVLAEHQGGSGMIRRIWITVPERTPENLRGMRLRCTWDGAATPAVDAPLGDFFGHALGKCVTFTSALFASPEGRSFLCTVPMPFRSGMRIEVVNESSQEQSLFFYEVDYTVGDHHDDQVLYFHAIWRRERSCRQGVDFELLPTVRGRGRVLGTCQGVIPNVKDFGRSWWGEGEVKAYLDGDETLPTLCGTGTEDYIGTGWGQGRYDQPYQGCNLVDEPRFRYGFYRLHVPDPLVFTQSCRLTIQQIGCWSPGTIREIRRAGTPLTGLDGKPIDIDAMTLQGAYGLFERWGDDWSVCTWFYLDRPENGLPPLAPVAERVVGLD